MSSISIKLSAGIFKYPSSIATLDTFSILLPLKTIFLFSLIEALAICCILWIFEANVATITLPFAPANILFKVSPIVFSDSECPCLSIFVLSAKSNSTPFLPKVENLFKSITLPSIGV